jgi:hypothetical protein
MLTEIFNVVWEEERVSYVHTIVNGLCERYLTKQPDISFPCHCSHHQNRHASQHRFSSRFAIDFSLFQWTEKYVPIDLQSCDLSAGKKWGWLMSSERQFPVLDKATCLFEEEKNKPSLLANRVVDMTTDVVDIIMLGFWSI